MTDRGYTFNWHDLSDLDDYESFLSWALVNLTVDTDENGRDRSRSPEEFARLSEATKNFTEVTLTVQVSGIDVNPEHLLRGIEHNMKRYARDAAAAELRQLTRLTDLHTTISALQAAVVRDVRQAATDLDIALDYDEDEL